jgi:hypothetical protein
LDKLVNDKDPDVRIAVAKQGYGLDILVNDKDPDVRQAVIDQGYIPTNKEDMVSSVLDNEQLTVPTSNSSLNIEEVR